MPNAVDKNKHIGARQGAAELRLVSSAYCDVNAALQASSLPGRRHQQQQQQLLLKLSVSDYGHTCQHDGGLVADANRVTLSTRRKQPCELSVT